MQTNTRQLDDEQRQAVADLLALFPNECGLDKLAVEELTVLGEYVAAVADESARQGYDAGYTKALLDSKDYQDAVIESQHMKRAH